MPAWRPQWLRGGVAVERKPVEAVTSKEQSDVMRSALPRIERRQSQSVQGENQAESVQA